MDNHGCIAVRDYKYLLLYMLIGYISSQLHEIGHWIVAMSLNSSILMGFDKWFIEGVKGPLWPILAAGPLTTLILSIIGLIVLVYRQDCFVKQIGFYILFFNTLFSILSVVGELTRNPDSIYQGLCCTELAWKALLAPFSIIVLAIGIKSYTRYLNDRVSRQLVKLFILTIITSLITKALDIAVWSGYSYGNPVCSPIYGFLAPVIIVNAIALAILVVLVTSMSKYQ